MNPLFNQMNQVNINRLQKDIESFRRNFRGDPKAQVEEMLRTGQLSQQQFDALAQQANQLVQMLNRGHG